jgi:hypothetical protein
LWRRLVGYGEHFVQGRSIKAIARDLRLSRKAATTPSADMRGGWAKTNARVMASAFVPLTFAPGEAYQFDWSHEIVVMDGVTTTVKVAHVRLCHSRMTLARAYPRET